MTTGLVWHELCMWHDTGSGAGSLKPERWLQPGVFAENPETKRRARNLLEVSGLWSHLTLITPQPATADMLLRVHDESYVARISRLSRERGGDAGDGHTPFGAGGYEIALLAAGGAVAAVDAVLEGHVDNCYALIRPPGHHAEREHGMGYCIFGNTAVAAYHAIAAHRLERVAIIDWDVHHGNGTQRAFYDDRRVLTVSLHQDNSYPTGSGSYTEQGAGAGHGFNVNVPLPPGSGVGAYLHAFMEIVEPALTRHRPQLILVASGFDSSAADPLGRMMLHSDGYRTLTERLMARADELSAPLAMVHEGGYSEWYVPFCMLAVMEALAGQVTAVRDPYLEGYAALAGQPLQPHQREAIAIIKQAVALRG